jgi:hypothetical protein
MIIPLLAGPEDRLPTHASSVAESTPNAARSEGDVRYSQVSAGNTFWAETKLTVANQTTKQLNTGKSGEGNTGFGDMMDQGG